MGYGVLAHDGVWAGGGGQILPPPLSPPSPQGEHTQKRGV